MASLTRPTCLSRRFRRLGGRGGGFGRSGGASVKVVSLRL